MEIDVKHTKQRNKRRERAQRMQAERDKDADGVGIVDSADEDSKPIRPPQRRKKANLFKEPSPILEEDVVDGFAILSFKTYEDLEYAIKLANKRNEKRLSAITELTTIMLEDKLPKIDTGQIKEEGDGRDREREWNYKNNNHHTTNNIAFNHDPGTSDDSGRASERLTTSSVAQRDQDSSRDRLSDASSRCSSGKGYICDSEGDDDKASDGGSTTTASTSAAVVPRKSVDTFPTTGVPLNNGPALGLSGSPLSPCPPTNSGPAPPAPSPAPAALPPPSLPYTSPSPLQVTNEPLNTHLTSLPNHVGSLQNNGQTTSTTATIPNGKASTTVNNKIPSTSTSTSTSLSSPNAKQSMASSPSATSPSSVANTTTTIASSKKHSPTISNLLAPTTSTTSSSTVPVSTTTSVTAIPSPVSSTSSLSSISIPSRLGSSTPPVITPTSNATNIPSSSVATPPSNLQQSPAVTTQPQIHPHAGLDPSMQPLGSSPLLPSHPAALGLPPTLNGPASMPHLMGLGSLGPLGHMPYRAMYPYGPLYSPYGIPPHPYGAIPPTPIPPPALSPRSLESRRDSSPLVLSKPIKPVTPNSNSQPLNNSQSTSNSTTPAGPNTVTTISPRSFSPSREKDSFSVNSLSSKSTAATPGSSVIPQSPSTALPSTPSLLAPYVNVPGQPLSAASSASSIYPSSSLPYPAKIPGLIAPPSSWPHPSALPTSVSSPVTTIAGQRPTQPTPASNTSTPFAATPSFTAPLPPPPAVPTTVASVNSLPFSAESLLTNKPDQTDLLRRELDSRFLDRSGLGVPTSQSNPSSMATAIPTTSAPSTQTPPGSANQAPSAQPPSNLPFLRQELHHHQHQHTHLHQHQHQHQAMLPTAPAGSLFPPPLFKDIPKIGAVESPFYRTGPLMGIPPYSAYPSGILHPGLSGPTQFVPPSHLQSFVPKQQQQGPQAIVDPTKPKQVKTGRWNAMHVRIAWEIYHHQAKQNPEKASSAAGVKTENMLRPHMYPPPPSPNVRPHELTTPTGFPPTPPSLQGRPFDPLSPNFLSSPSSLGVSPFGRYASPFGSPFGGLSPYSRELPLGAGGPLDPWRSPLSRTVGGYPPPPTSLAGSWGSLKPDPGLDAARREAEERERQMREREERERERQRREREERERKEREREEKLRKEQQEREQRERERERKEKERREMERREMERERMLQQQRLNDSAKAVRDRSPLRNGDSDIRIKEEPRKDEAEMLMRADPRYQMAAAWQMGRHPAHMLPPPHLSRPGMLPPSSLVGFPPNYAPAPGWPSPLDPYRDPYRLMDPMMRYQIPNPMLDAMRAEEAKAYAQASALYANRGKDPSPVPQPGHPPPVPSPHHRMPPNGPLVKPPSVVPSPIANDMHKKEDAPR